ncbi:MAG: hypothetical protein H6887_14980 [Hoeflea sp.]|nr:hypothetical protein [Hoeflea sp.]
MPSVTPTSDNGYQWPPAPARSIMDRLAWNTFGADLHARLLALEDINDGIEALQAELQTFGVERLNDAINPLIESTQATLDQLVIDLAAAEAAVAALLAGGVPAADVTESETRVFVTPAQKAEIGQLRADLTDGLAAVAVVTDALAALIATIKFHTLRPVITVTAAHTAVAGQRVYADSTGGAFNVTTPLNPADGVTFAVYPKGLEVSVVPNGTGTASTIEGLSTMLIDQANTAVEFTFMDGDWKMEFRRIVNG